MPDRKTLADLEERARDVGSQIGGVCDELDGVGFALLMFEFRDGGWSTYISNGQRESMVKALRETADRLERGLMAEPGTGGRLPS